MKFCAACVELEGTLVYYEEDADMLQKDAHRLNAYTIDRSQGLHRMFRY